MVADSPRPLVVISHCKADETLALRLRKHLNVVAEYGDIEVWDEHQVETGEDAYFKLYEQLERAAIAICLISVDYLDSPFNKTAEIKYLLERRRQEDLMLLPILLGSCPWEAVPWLKRIEMFPRDSQAISLLDGPRQTAAFAEFAMFVHEKTSQLDAEAASQPIPAPVEGAVVSNVLVDIDRLPETGYKLFGREKELGLLDDAWASDTTNVLSLIAWGGVGKSTLVKVWLDRLAADDYRGARRVFGWSFYSQGTKDQVTSADFFFDEALRWFGEKDFEKLSAWDKGALLAKCVSAEKVLLVLDGMEPLQSGNEFDRGTIKDPGLKTLLEELIRENAGLCVVTSRETLTEFADAGATASQVDLERISAEAGRSLLRVGRVAGSDDELEQAAREFGPHALAVSLLASYLRQIDGHHVSERSRIADIDVAVEKGRHARRVIAAFEETLGEGSEVEWLRLLGLFDRPADGDLLGAVIAGEPIEGLTAHLRGLADEQRGNALRRLRDLGLVAHESRHRPDVADAHPLVREHFEEQLAERFPESAKEAHRRLYEHLKTAAPELPDTLEKMMPLYHAVAHGCAAGLHQEALADVYYARISRQNQFFSTNQLGAFGADLGVVASFFERTWVQPVAEITPVAQAWILNQAGFRLRALGRLADSAEPMAAGFRAGVERSSWANASRDARNLSEIHLTLGDISGAVRLGGRCIELADRSLEADTAVFGRATLANTLHSTGRRDKALAAFREAEAMQENWQHQFPLLYGSAGHEYCELLLGEPASVCCQLTAITHQQERHDAPTAGEIRGPKDTDLGTAFRACRKVRERARKMFEWRVQGDPLLCIAVDHLSLGRTHLLEAILDAKAGSPDRDSAVAPGLDAGEQHLDNSVSFLRRAGTQNELPRGLVARAALRRIQGRFEDAEHDLLETETIAGRGEMLIFLIDAAIERCWLGLAQGDRSAARESLERTKGLIKTTEKPYEPHVPDWEEWEPPSYVGVFKEGEIVGYHRRNPEIELLDSVLGSG